MYNSTAWVQDIQKNGGHYVESFVDLLVYKDLGDNVPMSGEWVFLRENIQTDAQCKTTAFLDVSFGIGKTNVVCFECIYFD